MNDEQMKKALRAAQLAAKPFAEFIADWDAFPPLGLDDVIYSRHADPKGPMRNVRVSDLRKLLRALGVEIPKRPNAVVLRKSQLQLSVEEAVARERRAITKRRR